MILRQGAWRSGMSNNTHSSAEQGIHLQKGQVLWLDDSELVWQVREGTVDIFAVTGREASRYQQVFLQEAGEGQMLFGLPQGTEGERIRLMITATQETRLVSQPRVDLMGSGQTAGSETVELVYAMVEDWLGSMLAGPGNLAAPRSFTFLEPGQTLTLAEAQTVRTERSLTWVRVVSGDVTYGPVPEYTLSREGVTPLIETAWLTITGQAELYGLSSDEVLELASQAGEGSEVGLWQLLDRSHELFRSIIQAWFAQTETRDRERLAARKKQQENLLHGAAGHLLKTDLPDLIPTAGAEGPESPLLAIAKAVAVQLGIAEQQVRFPAGADPMSRDINLLKNILRLAGMVMRPVRLDVGWQSQDNGPLIGYDGPRRSLVALLPLSSHQYRLFNPETSETTPVSDEIAGRIEGNAYTVYTALPGKSVSLSDLFKFLINKCWPGDGWNVLFISLVAGIIPILTPFVTKTIFEDLIPNTDRQGLVMVVQVMIVAAFATAGTTFARSVSVLRIKNKSRLAAESALWLRLLSLPPAFFRKYQAGDLTQRMVGISHITALLSSSALSSVFNAMFSFWSLAVMLYYSRQLTAAAAAVWVVYLGIAFYLVRRVVKAKRQMTEATGKTAGQVLQIFNGLSKFRMQGAETQAFYLWSKRFGEQWKWNRIVRWSSNWLELLNTLQPIVLTMLTFWLTMSLLTKGDATGETALTLPQFMAFNAALTGLNVTLTGLIAVTTNLMEIVPLVERIKPILETEPEVSDDKAEAGELTGRIEVGNVTFRYLADAAPVLRSLSLHILPGQYTAIVGSSGSGKSTLLRLLLGFEKPESGSIYFDGQDLAELNIASVRGQMGVVLQGGQLMAGDILTNIIGSLPLTMDDAWQAAEMVGLAEDIRAMPMSMHTVISEGGSNISGGQRQRILIARSIVHRPRIIIFDEATSALDNRTQAIVTESLDKLKATRIVVAHRLSTIMAADKIFVMDKGDVIQVGNYESLIAEDGLFAAMARRQLA